MFNIQASQELNSNQVVPESDLLTTLVEMEGIDDLLVGSDIPTTLTGGQMISSSNLVQSMDSVIGLESSLGVSGDVIMMDTSMGPIDTNMTPLMSHQAQTVAHSSPIISQPMTIGGESIVQPILAQVSTNPVMQVASDSMDNSVENKTATILPAKIINTQPTMSTLQPIKFSTAQPILFNPMTIGTNVQFHGGNISYILPTPNTLAKQTIIANKSTPIQMGATLNNMNVVTNVTPSTLIPSTGATIINPMVKKVIQTSQTLVMSPIKQPTAVKSNISMPQQTIAIKSSCKPTVVTNMTSDCGKTNLAATLVPVSTSQAGSTSQQQQQQLIILSPMKSASQTTKQIIPSIKIMQPNPKLPTIAPAPAKRVIAPAPVAPKTGNPTTTTGNAPKQMSFISNKNVQFISLVPASGATQLTPGTKLVPLKPSTPTKPASANSSTTVKPNMVQVVPNQKLLINSNSIKFSNNTSASPLLVSSSSAANNQPSPSKRSQTSQIWMIPKTVMNKVNENAAAHMTTKSTAKYVPIAPNPNQSSNLNDSQRLSNNFSKFQSTLSNSGSTENFEETRRKPCNCTRSQCLKLYCDCFANGEFCNNCNCVSCCNNLMNEEIRQKAIRLCLERNPNAFHPKIGQAAQSGDERRHNKGCCCKRSGCLKNYCECYEAKILCSNKCKCVGCKNFEESTERKTLMHLADAAEVRSAQQSVATKLHIWGPDLKPKLPVKVKSDCPPFNVFTIDILEATASCLFSQGEEGEYENYNEENIESLIFEQFGECLSQILSLANNGVNDDAMEGNSDDEEMLPTEIEFC